MKFTNKILSILILNFLFIFILSTSSSSQWIRIFDIPHGYVTAFADNGNILYAMINYEGVYKSTDNGINWAKSDNGISYLFLNTIVAKDSLVFVGTDTGIFRSTNFGNNWVLLNTFLISTNVLVIANNFLFAGTYMQGIFRSSDWGENWIPVNDSLPTFYPHTYSLAYSNNNLYAGIESFVPSKSERIRHIYKSTNFGSSWFITSQDIDSIRMYRLYACDNLVLAGSLRDFYISTNFGVNWRVVPEIPVADGYFGLSSIGTKNIFVSSIQSGFYVSNNYGQNWILKNDGLNGNTAILTSYRYGDFLFLATSDVGGYRAIYRRPVLEVINIRKLSSNIPDMFKLYQNYPNPFNPTTIIKYNIPKLSSPHVLGGDLVVLKVFDILGRETVTLVNEKQSPGTYEVSFDGSKLSSGIYFYRIQADNFVQTNRMVLIK